jgi:hypothetical protein
MRVARRFVSKHVRVRETEAMLRDCDESMKPESPESPASCTSRREREKYSRREELKKKDKVSA